MPLRRLLLPLLLWSFGCSTTVDLERPPAAPAVTMNYNGIRAGARRFPDYGVVDRRILKRPQ